MEIRLYTVRSGDTLYRIATRNGTTVNVLARYNGIADPELIYPGQVIKIPVSTMPDFKKAECVPKTEYIVKPGDTLAGIALRSGVGMERIAKLNNIEDPDRITAGQVLKIPLDRCAEGREYIVKKGDTLYSIAEKTGTTVGRLADINGIGDPDLIYAGQGIRLPYRPGDDGNGAVSGKDTQEKTGVAPTLMDTDESRMTADEIRDDSSVPVVHTVQPGDTLWKIGAIYGVSVAYLINRNRLTCPDRLTPGQKLFIS